MSLSGCSTPVADIGWLCISLLRGDGKQLSGSCGV